MAELVGFAGFIVTILVVLRVIVWIGYRTGRRR